MEKTEKLEQKEKTQEILEYYRKHRKIIFPFNVFEEEEISVKEASEIFAAIEEPEGQGDFLHFLLSKNLYFTGLPGSIVWLDAALKKLELRIGGKIRDYPNLPLMRLKVRNRLLESQIKK